MEKFWKSVAIGSILLLVLTVGISMVMAQEDQDPPPPAGPNFGDEDGDGLCDDCGEVPDGDFGRKPGEMLEGMMPRGGHGMRGSWGESGMTDFHGGRGMHGTSLISILAGELEMSIEEIVDELSAGISIADLADAHSVNVQEIVDAFMAEHEAFLNDAVEAGRMTQEQAQEMLDHMAEEIVEHINEPWTGEHGPGGMGGVGGHGRGTLRGGCGLDEGAVPQRGLDQGSDSDSNL